MATPSQINLTKNANLFLLFEQLKNTESAQLWVEYDITVEFNGRTIVLANVELQSTRCHVPIIGLDKYCLISWLFKQNGTDLATLLLTRSFCCWDLDWSSRIVHVGFSTVQLLLLLLASLHCVEIAKAEAWIWREFSSLNSSLVFLLPNYYHHLYYHHHFVLPKLLWIPGSYSLVPGSYFI